MGRGRTAARIPPEAEATMGATMGRSQAAVIWDRVVWWWYMLVEMELVVSLKGMMGGFEREKKEGGRLMDGKTYITKGR